MELDLLYVQILSAAGRENQARILALEVNKGFYESDSVKKFQKDPSLQAVRQILDAFLVEDASYKEEPLVTVERCEILARKQLKASGKKPTIMVSRTLQYLHSAHVRNNNFYAAQKTMEKAMACWKNLQNDSDKNRSHHRFHTIKLHQLFLHFKMSKTQEDKQSVFKKMDKLFHGKIFATLLGSTVLDNLEMFELYAQTAWETGNYEKLKLVSDTLLNSERSLAYGYQLIAQSISKAAEISQLLQNQGHHLLWLDHKFRQLEKVLIIASRENANVKMNSWIQRCRNIFWAFGKTPWVPDFSDSWELSSLASSRSSICSAGFREVIKSTDLAISI